MSKQTADYFDIVIVGGGMAGATMALAPLQLNIAIIEVHPYQEQQTQPSFDDRCLALSWSSRQIYAAMGLWDQLTQTDSGKDNDNYAAIKHIHVSDRGHFGAVRLSHQEEGVPALGYVVESRVIGEVLLAQLKQHNNIHIYNPAQVEQVDNQSHTDKVSLTIKVGKKTQHLDSALLIIADGVNSRTRESLGIRVNQRSYAQTAIIANIETELPHQNVAYERFTDTGPLAMLPLSRKRCSLVWTAKDHQVKDIMAWDDRQFGEALQDRFGFRLGAITQVGKRSAYPLVLMTLDNRTLQGQPRVALIGNAAHGIHPVAGQGFNLGLRDITALAELIAADIQQHKTPDPGDSRLLSDYWQWRQADIRQVTTITNSLIKLFSNNSMVLTALRDSGLLLTDIIAPLRHMIAAEAMGKGILQGQLSKMAVGQSLYKICNLYGSPHVCK